MSRPVVVTRSRIGFPRPTGAVWLVDRPGVDEQAPRNHDEAMRWPLATSKSPL